MTTITITTPQQYCVPNHVGYTLVQDDLFHTPLPNGALRWFGFHFDRVELPDQPILRGDEPPRWVVDLPGFVHHSGILDARITIAVDEFHQFQEYEDGPDLAVPKQFYVTLDAPGMDHAETFTCASWAEVQKRCSRAEDLLECSYSERHASCVDDTGEPTEHACQICSTT